MRTLPHNFMIFQLVGLWRPVHYPPGWKTHLYNLYTWLSVFLVSTITIFESIDFFGSMDDVDAMANNSFMLLSMVGVCGKILTILRNRYELIRLTEVLKRYPCLPQTDEEKTVEQRFDRMARLNVLRYGALTGTAVIALVMVSIFQDVPRRILLYSIWLPYDTSSTMVFWITYIYQVSAHVVGASINVAFDTLIPGLMMQTCCQLKILKHRIKNVPEIIGNMQDRENEKRGRTIGIYEANMVTECVKHHLAIFKFAKKSNDVFGFIIFLQYTVSTFVLCVSVFALSKTKLFSTEFSAIFIYLACMSVQIFQYCFYGSEVTFESISISDGIYEMDWTSFSIDTKKSLIVFMICALRPIKFTTLSVVTLNLDSFNSLVKLSYSAYNVLQRSGQ